MKKLAAVAAKAFFFFMGWALLVGFLSVPDRENPAIWRFYAELIPFLCITGISILFWLAERRNKNTRSLSFIMRVPVKNCLMAMAAGVLWLGASYLILAGIGVVKIGGYHAVPMLWLWLFSAFINTAMQELLVRGYLYQMIKSNYNVIAAAVVSSSLFTLLHGGAFEAGIIPVLNVLTMSFLMTIVLEYTRSLLAPIIMHFIWNGIGAVILGSVSLADDYPHLFTALFSGNTLLSGGPCMLEGSIIVLFMNLIFIVLFKILMTKRHKQKI